MGLSKPDLQSSFKDFRRDRSGHTLAMGRLRVWRRRRGIGRFAGFVFVNDAPAHGFLAAAAGVGSLRWKNSAEAQSLRGMPRGPFTLIPAVELKCRGAKRTGQVSSLQRPSARMNEADSGFSSKVFLLRASASPRLCVNCGVGVHAFACTFAQTCTCGSPRKYQTIDGPSICHTSQTPSLPTSWFL